MASLLIFLLIVASGARCAAFWGEGSKRKASPRVAQRCKLKLRAQSSLQEISYVSASTSEFNCIASLLSSAFDSPGFLFKFISRASFAAELRERHTRLVLSNRNHTMLIARTSSNEVVGFLELGVLPMGSAETQAVVDEFAVGGSGSIGSIGSSGSSEDGRKPMKYPIIGNLVIKETFRRQGIARQLLSNAEVAAQSWGRYDRLVVAVDPLNTPAVELYTSLGFSRVATAKQKIVKDLMQQERLFATMVKGLELRD